MLSGVELTTANASRDAFPAAWRLAAKKQLRHWM
jgi:hypothetical protein